MNRRMDRRAHVLLKVAVGLFSTGCVPEGAPTIGGGGGSAQGTGGATTSTGGATTSTGGATTSTGGATGTGGATASGGAPGSGGAASGGRAGTGGAASGGAVGTGGRGSGGVTATGGATGTGGAGGAPAKFSFFVTSVDAMKMLSGNPQGFGGDLRFGEATGLAGADKICTQIAEKSMPGAGAKTWRAFLSAVGPPVVNAIDRVGTGPWYDRLGRVVASNKTQLLMERPGDAEAAIKNDLPNESGVPNHTDGAPGCTGNACPDNHDTLTGTGPNGMLYMNNKDSTCSDWTSSAMSGKPWCGHSWPRQGSGVNWMSALAEGGCAPGINLMEMGGPMRGVYTVGTGGGYGGIYCFALTP